MPLSALDQHLKGICRPPAHPGASLPDRAPTGGPVGVALAATGGTEAAR
ncbi:hypothetical protein HCA58_01935 [Micromonospora sp. HNM0581]|nr:hypothetical protein [Micromonospora sp. HNM0581]NLU77171.1 hypothetical protein [Micromonospora sp. HNM0581]